MPQVTIYLSRDLAEAVKRHGLPVSETCQTALRKAVAQRERRGQLIGQPPTDRTNQEAHK
jgi:post-segregation antitoxin (ccd killing protein)